MILWVRRDLDPGYEIGRIYRNQSITMRDGVHSGVTMQVLSLATLADFVGWLKEIDDPDPTPPVGWDDKDYIYYRVSVD